MLIPLMATSHWRPAMTRHCVSDLVLFLILTTSCMDGQHNAQLSDEESESQRSCVAYLHHTAWAEFMLFSLRQHCNNDKKLNCRSKISYAYHLAK